MPSQTVLPEPWTVNPLPAVKVNAPPAVSAEPKKPIVPLFVEVNAPKVTVIVSAEVVLVADWTTPLLTA